MVIIEASTYLHLRCECGVGKGGSGAGRLAEGRWAMATHWAAHQLDEGHELGEIWSETETEIVRPQLDDEAFDRWGIAWTGQVLCHSTDDKGELAQLLNKESRSAG